jgi:protease-4
MRAPRAVGLLSMFACALAACEGRPRTVSAGPEGQAAAHTGPWVAVVDLSEGIPEQSSGGLLGLASRGPAMSDLVREIERLGRSADLRGVMVRIGTAHIGLARATEIGSLLATVRATLPVWCHADDYSNATMYLAARGCSRVWAAPASTVDAVGIAAQTVYFHKLLTNELGLSVDFLQVGKFKGAEEPFTRDGPSPEARASLETTLADLRACWLEGVEKGRPGPAAGAVEDGPYSGQGAKDRGLVDEVGYFDEARGALERSSGAVRAEVRVGPGAQEGVGGGLTQAVRELAGESFGGAPVALVRATGAISMEGEGLLDSGGIAERRLVRMLSRLERDDDVKTVVLRIDSPGGSALASDLLWHALMRLRGKKPLVVSVGDLAASGGYYLASAGTTIFADEASIVGSIGVVGGKIAANQALEKIGVHAETFSARPGDARAASRAAFESLLMPWDDATRERVLETMTGIYELFLSRVAEGRRIPVERVRASAEGRIFGGRDALARGLVDQIGGLREAIERARVLGGLPKDARVGAADEARGLFQTLFEDDPPASARRPPEVAALAGRLAPELVPFLGSVAGLLDGETVLCAMPFALTVK